MIGKLTGVIDSLNEDGLLIDVNGVGYVVLDYARATPELQSLITSKLHLTEIGQDGSFHLYRP